MSIDTLKKPEISKLIRNESKPGFPRCDEPTSTRLWHNQGRRHRSSKITSHEKLTTIESLVASPFYNTSTTPI